MMETKPVGQGVVTRGPGEQTPPQHAGGSNGQPRSAAAHGPAEHMEGEIPSDLRRPHPVVIVGVFLLLAGVLLGLFFLGWYPRQAEKKLAAQDAEEVSNAVPVVTVAAPKSNAASHEVVLPCDIRPNQETLIYPRATGYLKKLYVDIQDKVEKDQLLAEIDAPEVDAQLEQARAAQLQSQADVKKAQADLDLAQRTLDRYQNIQGTSITQQERDEKSSARDQAAAALEQTKANVKVTDANVMRLEVMQSFEKITAPFSGTITARNYDVGALLSATNSGEGSAHELFRLTQATTLRVFISMPQVEASDVKAGQEATLTVRNFPDKTFTGTVARIADSVDPNTRTMPFELHFANPDGKLYAGMYGEVRIKVTEPRTTLTVPTSALVFDAAGTQVALVKDGRVHFQPVVVGRDLGTELEIHSGLTPEDRVIVNPGERLAEGVEVQANEAGKPRTAIASEQTPPGTH
jgi:RND family efflux transporter MFP subunit